MEIDAAFRLRGGRRASNGAEGDSSGQNRGFEGVVNMVNSTALAD
jgi:hypothetical protein